MESSIKKRYEVRRMVKDKTQSEKIKEYLSTTIDPVHVDSIILATGINKRSIRVILSILKRKGDIEKVGVNTYKLKREVVKNDAEHD